MKPKVSRRMLNIAYKKLAERSPLIGWVSRGEIEQALVYMFQIMYVEYEREQKKSKKSKKSHDNAGLG